MSEFKFCFSPSTNLQISVQEEGVYISRWGYGNEVTREIEKGKEKVRMVKESSEKERKLAEPMNVIFLRFNEFKGFA